MNGTGALSAADIAGPWTTVNDGAFGLLTLETPGPDYIAIFDADLVTPLVPGTYAGTDAFMECLEGASQCYTLFNYTSAGATTFPGNAISGTVTISTVGTAPEPGTFSLLVLGICLAGAGVLHRKMAF